MTYQEFRQLAEANALDDHWLFGEGWDIMCAHPEFCDQMIVEQMLKSCKKQLEAAE